MQHLKYFLILLLLASPAHALGTVTILADNTISVPVVGVVRSYTRTQGIIVNTSFASPETQDLQISEGSASDVLITPNAAWIDTLKTKGLVDVNSQMLIGTKQSEISKQPIPYYAVAIAGDNMEEARKFLEYLKTLPAKIILRDKGLLPN